MEHKDLIEQAIGKWKYLKCKWTITVNVIENYEWCPTNIDTLNQEELDKYHEEHDEYIEPYVWKYTGVKEGVWHEMLQEGVRISDDQVFPPMPIPKETALCDWTFIDGGLDSITLSLDTMYPDPHPVWVDERSDQIYGGRDIMIVLLPHTLRSKDVRTITVSVNLGEYNE